MMFVVLGEGVGSGACGKELARLLLQAAQRSCQCLGRIGVRPEELLICQSQGRTAVRGAEALVRSPLPAGVWP